MFCQPFLYATIGKHFFLLIDFINALVSLGLQLNEIQVNQIIHSQEAEYEDLDMYREDLLQSQSASATYEDVRLPPFKIVSSQLPPSSSNDQDEEYDVVEVVSEQKDEADSDVHQFDSTINAAYGWTPGQIALGKQ